MIFAFIGLLDTDAGNAMAVDGPFRRVAFFVPLSPSLQMTDDGGLNASCPFISHAVLLSNRTELFQRLYHITNDGIRSAYAIVAGKLDNIITSNVLVFPSYHQTMLLIGQETACVENIGHVVGWRKSPCTLTIHDEREVLMMVIGIVGKNIEHHTTEEFLAIHFRKMQLSTYCKKLFIGVGFRVHCCQCLSMQLSCLITVESLGEKMICSIHLQQTRLHHADTCRQSHFIKCLFQLSRRTHLVTKLQDVVIEARL